MLVKNMIKIQKKKNSHRTVRWSACDVVVRANSNFRRLFVVKGRERAGRGVGRRVARTGRGGVASPRKMDQGQGWGAHARLLPMSHSPASNFASFDLIF